MSTPIPNPDPKEVTITTDSQWFSLFTPNSPTGQARIKAWGYDTSLGAVAHAEQITSINIAFAKLMEVDEDGNPLLPLSYQLILDVTAAMTGVIEEIETHLATPPEEAE